MQFQEKTRPQIRRKKASSNQIEEAIDRFRNDRSTKWAFHNRCDVVSLHQDV